ncbi:unnamed protein product [Oncorhynchus mykiss]|uniref:VWFA domain-containing protein n=1 Tax=Oncorhynchus mykiss TaxID=8022 RepID=A0A060WW90_ONCMY|nr:unnamed protein product [Oncorhynchus mykiss]
MRKHRLLPLCALLGVLFAGLLPKLDAQDCAQGLAADIYFLVDSSWSMGQENFEHVRQFLYSVVKALHEGGGGRFQFALVQYSGSPKTEFQLNTYPSPLGALAHIRAMAYRGGGTRTGLGLDFLIRAHLNAAAGSRAGEGVAQAVVILTDGRSQDDVAEPAQVLRLAGVSMFAVGVQDAVDWELREMASVPQDIHIFSVDSFQALKGIIQDLVVGLCGAVTQAGGSPMAVEAKEVPRDVTGNNRGPVEESSYTCVAMSGSSPLLTQLRVNGNIHCLFDMVKTYRSSFASLVCYNNIDYVTVTSRIFKQFNVPVTSCSNTASRNTAQLLTMSNHPPTACVVMLRIICIHHPLSSRSNHSLVQPTCTQESADLVLLIDGSENVGAANFPRVRDLAMKVIEGLDVGRDTIRVAVALYSADLEIQFFLNSYDTKAAVLDAVKALQFTGGDEANLGAALENVAGSLLSPASGGRAEEGVPQALVVISAGPSNDDFSAGDRALKAASVITFGVVVGSEATAELETIATDKSFVLSAPDFRAVASMGDQLLPYVNAVAQRTIVIQNEFTEAFEVGKRDIIFLVDSTMGATLINSLREFIKRFVDTMPIGPDQVQVGVTQFSNTARDEIELNAYGSKEDLSAALGRLKPRPGQVVNIGAALDFVRTNTLRADKGSRIKQGVPQLVLLLTSKKSSDSVGQAAEALQRMGVLTLAAGSKTADEQELKQIAFDESLVFMLKDFRALIRNPRLIVSPLSTLSGTVVIEGPTEPVVEITTVQTQRVVRDIVFMVDGSSYIGGANFPYVRDFIAGVVNQLDVRPDRVRIGLMQFAENPKIEFYLNTHNTKQDVLASLGELRLMGGSALNTGAAMDYALTNMFQASTGSRKRQGVQQVLLLITGGPSQDEVKRIADKVAVAGVLTFTVSAGQADEDYLKTVAFVPNLAYHESRFADLPSVVEQIMTPLTTVVGDTDITETEITEEPVVGGERDVAFLIDGSDNVRADFPYIRDFIIKVIEPLDIGQDRVRISVVQHSERPAPNFYLNTYKDKAEVLRAVNDLRLSGGRSLNTGMALKFMKDTILSPVHGSRAAQNVPQFLIVLTGGKSKDSVKESAGALKTDGVVPFGVGVKDADPKQIEAISHNPSFAFNVKEFSQLSTVQQKLNSYVSLSKENLKVVLEEGKQKLFSFHADAVKRDIVFLLDSSDGTRSGFPALRDFVQSVVDKLSVEENRERVSLVQYSDKPEAHFYLNSHKTKDAVIHAISNMRHKGGRSLNTGAALQFVRHNIFTASSGSRRLEGVPQVLILLTSKKSRDDVTGPAVALKDLEIVSIGVGVGDANFRELETISFQPGFTFQVSELSELPSIHPQFVALLKRLSKDTEEAVAPVTHGIPDLVVSSKRDIVFLLDGSDDSRNGLPAIREFIRRMANELDIDGDNVRVAVVQYSDDAAEYFHLKAHKTKRAVIYAVRSLRHKGGRLRNTGAALQYVRDNVFTASSGSRHLEGVPQILFLLIGGESSDDVTAAASDLKRLGVLSFAIGMKNVRQEELQSIAYSSRFIFNLPVFGELLSIQPEILAFVQSKMGIEPPTIVDAAQRDIVFLLDGSDDSRSGFPAMCGFVQRLVENLNVGENKDRVSVVQYSRNPEAHFLLNTYPEKQSVLGSIRSLQHKGGRPLNTGAALQYVKDNVFTASSGSRSQEGIPQILILLSGGKSQDDVGGAAAALKQDRIVPFSIGTRNSDILELQMIAHIPSYALSVPRFDDLESIQQQLLSFVKRVPRQPRVYQPTVVDNTESKQLDVVFLLDGSDETLNGFEAIRDFVQRVVEKLTVQETRDRVSVVQYSKEPEAHFYLNTYTTKQDIVDAVRQLRHKGGITLNTGAALQYVRDNIFTASSGSRRQEGIPQILVLLSGGRSNDDVRNAVKNLKAIDVMAIVVGMRNADMLELQTISDEPSYAFYAPNYNDLPNIQQQVFSAVQKVAMTTPNLPTTLIDATTDDRRDIVFLLDGSDDSRRIFPDIQDFMQRVVEKLNVDGNKDHVSVVQYSDTAEVNFNLGMHSTKDYVLDAVRGLRHKGGSPLNTGAALQYVRDNVFTASSGSRSLQGVPQILILLSGGRSTDDIRTPVTKLKEMGVISIGIGTGDADTLELQTISHEPNYALSITDFEDPTIQKELLSLLTEASHQPEPGAPTMHFESDKKDVVFLIDGSDNSKTGFEGIRRFAEKVVEILNVEENGDRVALVQYSGNATPNFYLNSYSSKNDVLNSIRSMRHTVGRPLNTGTALKFVRDTVFTASAGGRRAEGVPQYLFVFSGGRSSDDIMGPAQSLRGDGVRTFSIGTRNADTLELQMISFKPGDSFSVSNFNNLDSIHSSVTAVINGVQETPEMSTRVDGVDVVFLLDGSDEMQKGVQSICDFLGQFVEHLDIGPDKAQVAMIQYSNKPTTHFLLNTYSSKIDIMAEVRNINLEGGRSRNTGEALDYVKNNVFNTSSGSRRQEGIPQILILISGGKSQDDVLVPSESLKAEGIVLLTVAVKYANGAEMQSIAYSPNHAYLLREFSDLSLVRQQLLSAVVSHKDTVRPGLGDVKRDIVFLLDGSDDVRSRFTDIREFVAKVVEKFDVDKGKDQVAVLQYSNSAAVNFNLNAYKTRDDVLSAVRNLRPKGGRPLYTGTALQFVKDNVFTNNAASRRHEGAEQILVLLTGGRSRDSPRGPSRALKTLGSW